MTRSVPEWIGKTDDAKVPPRVRLRIFEREGGKCHLTGQLIRPGDAWDLDHKIPLILGGQHRESNLYPALQEPHRQKTKMEVATKSKIAAVRKKHLGIKKQTAFSKSRFRKRMDGTVVDRETGEVIGGRR